MKNLVTVFSLLFITALGSNVQSKPLSVEFTSARVMKPMKGSNVTAAYSTIKNNSNESVDLVIKKADAFKATELHETFHEGGKAGMRKIESLTIAPHQTVELKPGGHHIMLFDATKSFKEGDVVAIHFTANGIPLKGSFKVETRAHSMNHSMQMNHEMTKNPGACTFTLDPHSIHVGWTAFKTTKRVGVAGVFKKVTQKGTTHAKSFQALAKKTHLVIDQKSVDTKNPDRDKTLVNAFFSLLGKRSFSGKIKQISESDRKLVLSLTLNGKTRTVPMTYSYDNHTVTAKGQIDLLAFNANSALSSLNKECGDLHKGDDGVSKTWSEVEISFDAKVEKSCR